MRFTQTTPRIVLIGGGSGCAALYPDLVKATPHVTAIVAMSDSGGSTGEISAQLGLPPVGDLRNVMLAASTSSIIRDLQFHRYGGQGSLRGHTWGNMTLAACVDKYGLQKGVAQAAQILQVPGTILPVTLQHNELVMQDGECIIKGEYVIDDYATRTATPRIWLEPMAHINPDARTAIAQADLIVVAPGSVYTSLLAALTAKGVARALATARAPKVLIVNLVTEMHQTDGWHVVDYVQALKRHGVAMDWALYNTAEPSEQLLERYAVRGERPVDCTVDRFAENPEVTMRGANLLDVDTAEHSPHDGIKRTVIRHGGRAVRRQLEVILAK